VREHSGLHLDAVPKKNVPENILHIPETEISENTGIFVRKWDGRHYCISQFGVLPWGRAGVVTTLPESHNHSVLELILPPSPNPMLKS
jgi:hypothetical protein